jgi:hypothetical protein
MPAFAGVTRRLIVGQLLLPHFLQLLLGAETAERPILVQQLLCKLLINSVPVALSIRSVFSSAVDSFIPFKPQPTEIIHELLLVFRLASFGIRIFDPEHENSATVSCEEPIEKCRPHIPNMQKAGGAWGKSNSNRFLESF